ncbi:MAG: hypothetical protein J1F63_01580 [Oscillospiraceae bacterium]|nr:hypothetical protein [Oscillospiraceae bacterium]
MTAREWQFIVILIINLIVTEVYLILNIFRNEDNNGSCWIRALVMLMCPVTGVFIFFVSYIAFRLFFHREVDLSDVVFNKERVKAYMHADEDRERNLVSVEEAMEITDKDNLRVLMLNVLRGDIWKSLSTIAMAMNSEDSETAHYAASILQSSLDEFRTKVQKDYLYMQDEENEDEIPVYAHELIEYMDQVLKQRVLTGVEQKNQIDIMENICEMLYEKEPEGMTAEEFEAISLRLLELSEYERCEKWCDRSVKHHPDALSTYTCRLKLYFSMEDRETFFRILEELRNSNISVDQETLEMIRVFS